MRGPPGMRVEGQDPGCTCIPTGDAGADVAPPDEMPCPGDGPPPRVWDGGAILGNVCCETWSQARSLETPTGDCTGSKRCQLAVHQVCPGFSLAPPVGPVDEWDCLCDGSHWQCTLRFAGQSGCPPTDAGGGKRENATQASKPTRVN